jgi:hypothetical protein
MLGLHASAINACCNGTLQSSGGYTWCFNEPDVEGEIWMPQTLVGYVTLMVELHAESRMAATS